MIHFLRDGTALQVNIKTTIGTGWNWTTEIQCNSEPYAILLKQRMEEDLERKLEYIRRESYLQGWKDAKAKVKKRDWFPSWW